MLQLATASSLYALRAACVSIPRIPALLRAASVVTLTALSGCGGTAPPAPPSAASAPEAIEVSLVAVERRTLPRTIAATGTLFGTEEATLSAEVPGRVESYAFDVGDLVPPGEVLARIETIQYQLALDQKRAAMLEALATLGLEDMPGPDFDPATVPTVVKARREAENAESRHERGEKLWLQDPPLISEQDYGDLRTARDVARSDADVALLTARAALASARSREVDMALAAQRLDDAAVRAPGPDADGARSRAYAVAARFVSVGEFVVAGAPMFRVVATDPIKFRGELPERYAADVRIGQSATLRIEALRNLFAGRVARVNPQVNVTSRTFEVEIEVPNPDFHLRPGAFGRVAIEIGTDTEVRFVPESTIITFAGVSKVFSIAEGKAIEHAIRPGRRVDGLVELIGAPATLDRVVSSGGRRLASGTPVKEVSEGSLRNATTPAKPTAQN